MAIHFLGELNPKGDDWSVTVRIIRMWEPISAQNKGMLSLDMILSDDKLETDSKILLAKADMALQKYRTHMVVANELSTRKEEVMVVSSNEKITVRRDKTQPGSDVEKPLIDLIVDKHSAYIKDSDL